MCRIFAKFVDVSIVVVVVEVIVVIAMVVLAIAGRRRSKSIESNSCNSIEQRGEGGWE